MVEFALLGPMTVAAGGAPVTVPAKQRIVLAALLLRANRVVSVESIAEELWDTDPPASARNTTQGHVKCLRRILPADRVITRAPGYLIEVRADELDLDRFTRLCDRARLAGVRRDWQSVFGQLTEALALWRGEPLADLPSAVLQRTEAPRLCELRMQAIESRIDAELHLGRHRQLIADLRQLTGNEPLREVLHAQLMLALYRNGRQAEALEVFRCIDYRLRDELGISPGPGLQLLHQRIVIPERIADHDEALTWCEREYPVLMGAITAAESHRFDVHAWQLCSCLAGFFSVRARPHQWRSAALIALSAAGRANDGFGQAQARHGLACAYTTMGRYDDARPHYAAALRIYEALGDHLGQARVHLDLGLSYEFRERHHDVFGATPAQPRQERDAHAHRALTHARHASELFRAAGHHAGEAAACSAVGRSLALHGSAEEAVGCCERALQMNHDLGDTGAEAVALISLGYALHKAGRYADAAAACQRALDLSQRSRSPRIEAIALTHLAESRRSAGNIPAAHAAWEQALVILDDLQLPDADQVRTRLANAQANGYQGARLMALSLCGVKAE